MRTVSNRIPRARLRRVTTALVFAGALIATAGCMHHHDRRHGFTGDTSTVQVITAQIGGKNVFIPSTIVVLSGQPVKLSIFNTTDAAHGFSIPALGIAEVLPPQKEYEIALPALEPHQVLQINCQLHPAHRTATLVVLPARESKADD